MDFRQDYYAILECKPDATLGEVRAAYRRLAYLHHPDRNPNDPEAEERFKTIAEANEVLSNPFSRSAYDDHRSVAQTILKATEGNDNPAVDAANKRTHTTSRTVRLEKRVYIQGSIHIKYRGDRLDEGIPFSLEDGAYALDPTEINVEVDEDNILREPHKISTGYQRVYSETDLFRTPVAQPVSCTIMLNDGRREYYRLELCNLKVADPLITHTQKEEGISYGTLEGVVYAYVPQVQETEVTETTTVYDGETGRVEFKEEDGKISIRKEQYNKDGSKSWGPWQEVVRHKSPPPRKPKAAWFQFSNRPVSDYSGFAAVFAHLSWIVAALWLLSTLTSVWPVFLAIAIGLSVLALGSYLLRLIGRKGNSAAFFVLLLFTGVLLNLYFGNRQIAVNPQLQPGYDSLRTTTAPLPLSNNTADTARDALISHFIRWKDYDDSAYTVRLELLQSSIIQSTRAREAIDIPVQKESDISRIYTALAQQDRAKLSLIYPAFDTLRRKYELGDRRFAEAIVSCIQSMPYTLVLDGPCQAASYPADPFISAYLAACYSDCCISGIRYGVRAPVEMLGDLRGDCDTRALLLYTLLEYYGYDVALLTSFTYKHALLAIHFSGPPATSGTNLSIGGQPYYLWETTSKGFRPGEVPAEIGNTTYWEVSLLSKKATPI